MVKAVFIDMDNTLIETQALYAVAHLDLAQFVAALSGREDLEAIITHTKKKEVELFATYGYGAELLPQAFELTLLDFIPSAAPEEIRHARNIAYTVFRTEARLKEGVAEAVEALAAHFPLYLVTVGDAAVQNVRIEALPFRHLFSEMHVVSEKDTAAYRRILEKTGFEPHEVVMIGDSIRSDILPTVTIGMQAIYIQGDNWQAHEMQGHFLPERGVTQHDHLQDAAAFLIEKYIQGMTPETDKTGEAQKQQKAGRPNPPAI